VSTSRFLISTFAVLVAMLSGLWLTREREWVRQNTIPASQDPVLHVRVSEGRHKDHLAVEIQLAATEPTDMSLTVHCGSERLLIGGKEILPGTKDIRAEFVATNECGSRNVVLSNQQSLWMVFPRPESIGRDLLVLLPRIACSGKACSNLIIPASLEFHSEPVPNRAFTFHG
jgi:hypothetical protein